MIKAIFPRPSYWSRIKAARMLGCNDVSWKLLENGWVEAIPV